MSGEINLDNHFHGDPDLPEAYLHHARLTIADITGDVASTRELIEILGLMPRAVAVAPPTPIPSIEVEPTSLPETTEPEWDIRCQGCDDRPAEWIMWRAKCCDYKPEPLLACTRCLTIQLALPPPVWCVSCNHMFASMTDVFPTIEPLGGSRNDTPHQH
jgi:hypothetical protein